MMGNRRGPHGPRPKVENPGVILRRLFSVILGHYKFHCLFVLLLIVASTLANVIGNLFLKTLIDSYITPFLHEASPNFAPLLRALLLMACVYYLGAAATYGYSRIMISVTQGTMRSIREDLFRHMESLPIRYFDTHAHGDIMSVYTNDIDTLRQLISQSLPQLVSSAITVVSVFVSMIALNIPLTLIMLAMIALMIRVTRAVTGKSGSYFIEQQRVVLQCIETLRQRGAQARQRAPPVVVVAPQENLASRQIRDAQKVGQGVAQLHRPGGIPRQQYDVLLAHTRAPVLADALEVALPVRAEHVHGLDVAAGQVKIRNRKDSHARARPPVRLSHLLFIVFLATRVLFFLLGRLLQGKLTVDLAQLSFRDVGRKIRRDLVHHAHALQPQLRAGRGVLAVFHIGRAVGILAHLLEAEQAHVLPRKRGVLIAHRAQFERIVLHFALHFPLADRAILLALLDVVQFATRAFDESH